jgi:hypothetical protein
MRTSRRRRGGHPPHSGRMKPPQKLLRPLPDSARVGFSHPRSHRALVSGRPASAGFLFSSSWVSFRWLRRDGPESEWPSPSLPENPFDGKHCATPKCFFQTYTTMTKEGRCDLFALLQWRPGRDGARFRECSQEIAQREDSRPFEALPRTRQLVIGDGRVFVVLPVMPRVVR